MENKKKLIYADDLKKLVNSDIGRMYALRLDGVGPLSRFLDQIDQQPAVDAVEVVRGKWITDGLGDGERICSVCRRYALYTHRDRYGQYLTAYCSNCGAKMDLEG